MTRNLKLFLLWLLCLSASVAYADTLRVHFIDVGQGDAILLETSDVRILVDAGQRNNAWQYLAESGFETLELIIATHAHADHIGGFVPILDDLMVAEVWYNGQTHTTRTFERFIDAVLESDAAYHEPTRGETRAYGKLILEVLHPTSSAAEYEGHLHDKNIVVRAVFGEFSVLLTGDAESDVEQELIEEELELTSTVLKMGHHGSRTSSTLPFVEVISPEVAVYQAGEGNRYGHPHDEALASVLAVNAAIYGNDVHGTIIIETDGESYSLLLEHDEPAIGEAQIDTEALEPGCVDLNSANKQALSQIVHISEVRAARIIEQRERRPFERVRDLERITGLGPSRIEDIEAQGLACVE